MCGDDNASTVGCFDSRSPPPLKLGQTPVPQSGSVLCPLVMDYCGEDEGGLSLSLSLMKPAQRGVPRATQTMMVNMWGLKSLRTFCFLWGDQELEEMLVLVEVLIVNIFLLIKRYCVVI